MSKSEMFLFPLSEIKRGKSLTKFYDEIKDEIISFCDEQGQVSCFSSVCPHLAGEVILSEKSGEFRCKWHGLSFDRDGCAIKCRAKLALTKYETLVRDEKVYLIYEI